jgi:hypothetical protein
MVLSMQKVEEQKLQTYSGKRNPFLSSHNFSSHKDISMVSSTKIFPYGVKRHQSFDSISIKDEEVHRFFDQ